MNCDTCGKELNSWNAFEITSQDGRPLKVCKDCHQMANKKGRPVVPTTETWENTTGRNVLRERPFGITVIAFLQILGSLILVGLLVAIPLILEGKTVQALGEPLFYLLIIYAIFIIPITLFFAYGLLHGREWARFYSRFFALINLISAILKLNVLGVFIPFVVLFYLGKPHVVEYFDERSPLDSRFWPLVIIGVIVLLIFSCSLAILSNPLFSWNI